MTDRAAADTGRPPRPEPTANPSATPAPSPATSFPDVRRPRWRPEVPIVWRDGSAVQVGLDGPGCSVVEVVGEAHVRWLRGLDGLTPTAVQVHRLGTLLRSHARAADDAAVLLTALALAGGLDDGPESDLGPGVPPWRRAMLEPAVRAASLADGTPSAGSSTVRRRLGTLVEVRGSHALGAAVAGALAFAGVGALRLSRMVGDPARVGSAGLGVAGPVPDDLERPAAAAVRDAVARLGTGADLDPRVGSRTGGPDLVVLAVVGPLLPGLADPLVRDGTVHLLVRVDAHRAWVGPLVRPGRSACLRCLDEHRTDLDPAWPQLAAQLVARPGAPVPAADPALLLEVAGRGARLALRWLDGRSPADQEERLAMPASAWCEFPAPPHPRCWCGDGMPAAA